MTVTLTAHQALRLPEAAAEEVRRWTEQESLAPWLIRSVTLTSEDGLEGELELIVHDEHGEIVLAAPGEVATEVVRARWTEPFPVHVLAELPVN